MHYIQWLGWNAVEIQREIPTAFANWHEHGAVFTRGAGCSYGWREIPIYDYITYYEELGITVVRTMTAGQFRVTYPVR